MNVSFNEKKWRRKKKKKKKGSHAAY